MTGKIIFLALVAVAAAKPGGLLSPAAIVARAPLVAAPLITAPAPIVTASSSQYISRSSNDVVAAPVVSAPLVAPAPYVAATPYIVAAPYYTPTAKIVTPHAAPLITVPHYPASAPLLAVK